MSSNNRVLYFMGGLTLIILGIVIVMMNATVRFNLYSIALGDGYNAARLSGGLILIPLFISFILLIALDNKIIGQIIMWVSLTLLLLVLILSIRISLNTTSLFNLMLMFAPVIIGAGLVLKSFIGGNKGGNSNE